MASEYDIDNGRYDGTLDMLVWLASWTFWISGHGD